MRGQKKINPGWILGYRPSSFLKFITGRDEWIAVVKEVFWQAVGFELSLEERVAIPQVEGRWGVQYGDSLGSVMHVQSDHSWTSRFYRIQLAEQIQKQALCNSSRCFYSMCCKKKIFRISYVEEWYKWQCLRGTGQSSQEASTPVLGEVWLSLDSTVGLEEEQKERWFCWIARG